MVEGTLEIQWMNRQDVAATRQYRVHFSAYSGFQRGAQPHKEIVGDAGLADYLSSLFSESVSAERRGARIRQWILEVRSRGHIDLTNFTLTEQQCEPYRIPLEA